MAKPVFKSQTGPEQVSVETTTWVVDKPEGAVEGDCVLVTISAEPNFPAVGTSVFDTAVLPDGFAEAADPIASNWPHVQAVYYKVLEADEPSTWTWILANTARGMKRAVAYSNVDPTSPIHVSASLLAPSDPTPPHRYTSDEIVTTIHDCLLFLHFTTVSDVSFAWQFLVGGWVERGDLFSAFVTSDVAAERSPRAGAGDASMPPGTYSVTGTAGHDFGRGVETTIIALQPLPSTPVAPVNIAVPVASGNATDTFTVAVTDGAWTGDYTPSLSYQWRRGPVGSAAAFPGGSSTAISGATDPTYLLTEDDVDLIVFCVVRAVNAASTVDVASNGLGPVEPAPAAADSFLMTEEGLVPTRGRLMTASGLVPPA